MPGIEEGTQPIGTGAREQRKAFLAQLDWSVETMEAAHERGETTV